MFRLLTPNSSHWSCPSREAFSHVTGITPVPVPFLHHLLPHGSQELLRSYGELDSCPSVRPFIFWQVIPDQCKHQLSCAGGRSLKNPKRRNEHFLMFFCLPSKQQEEVALLSPLLSPSLSIFGNYTGTHTQSNLVCSKIILHW